MRGHVSEEEMIINHLLSRVCLCAQHKENNAASLCEHGLRHGELQPCRHLGPDINLDLVFLLSHFHLVSVNELMPPHAFKGALIQYLQY